MSVNAIEVENISKTFGVYKAVDDLSLEVRQGEIYGFLGPNGSGKSTTLRMILSLLKPDHGNIRINGYDLVRQRGKALRSIGCIVEKPDFNNYLTAFENLKQFARMHQLPTHKDFIYPLLDSVGLSGRERSLVKTYSHGMKQRLGLAQALLHNPSILILDEPNTGLDPQGIIELREMILKLNREGKTILLSSHILHEIESIADSMILINKGKTIAQGNVNDLLRNESTLLNIESNDNSMLLEKIQSSQFAHPDNKIEDNELIIAIKRNDIPAINEFIVQNGFSVYQLEQSRSLEKLFLKLTQSA